jgi:hypothetical protein
MTKSMTIDLGPDIHDWNSVSAMAPLLGVSSSAIYMALDEGRECNGYLLESREVDDELRSELDLHHSTRTVIRVSKVEPRFEQRQALRRAEERIAKELDDSPGVEEVPTAEPDVAKQAGEPRTEARVEELEDLLGVSRESYQDELQRRRKAESRVAELEAEIEEARNLLPSGAMELPFPDAIRTTIRTLIAQGGGDDEDLENLAWRFLAEEIPPHKAKSEFARALRRRSA